MTEMMKKVIDAVIKWAVPAAAAALVAAWQSADPAYRWAVLTAAALSAAVCYSAYKREQGLAALKARVEELEKEKSKREEAEAIMQRAFRAMLDDDMGKLYNHCLHRGYTTEDERRRYTRLDEAYHENKGNGEAERRKSHFEALPDEEEYKVAHGEMIG